MLRAERDPGGSALGTAAALVTAVLVLTSPAAAQQGGGTGEAAASGQQATQDSVVQQGPVDYERESYAYPERERNPFEPVSAGVQEGPRFQNLVLAGVIYGPSVGSVAVVVDRTTGRRHRVREGERLGQATILDIRRSEVVFSVSGPTGSRQETLQVEKQTEEVQR